MNYIKSFCCSDSYKDLEKKINNYCQELKLNPISISVIWSAGTYVAFVVMEDKNG